jgi:hypothetical protein
MTFGVLGRIAAVAVAVIVGACFSASPADAARACKGKIINGQCYAKKVTKKRVVAARKGKRVVVARKGLGDKQWHGWGASFHHEGVRYQGGTRNGPAMWYNNGEGGFHPAVFWKLYERQLP